jgi:outer membrane protein assembly factor BamB
MSGWIRWIAASVCVVTLTSPVLAQRHTTENVLPTQQELSRLGLERAWWGQATLNPRRDKVRNISIDEDMVYVHSTGGILTAMDSETGHQRWAVLLGQFDQPSYPVVSNEELAMVVVGSTMYGINKKTGSTLWTILLPGQPSTAPGVDAEQAYVGTLDGSVYAFSLRKVQRLYEQQKLPQWSHEAIVWRTQAGKEITSPPVPSARAVSYASRDGSLYAVGKTDRKLMYQLETDGAIVAPLATTGKMQFLASEDHMFYAIEADANDPKKNGRILWEFTWGLPIRRAPYVVESDLFVTPDRGGMYCLNAEDGSQRWWQPHLYGFLAIVGDSLMASDIDGNLIRVSRSNGAFSGSLPVRNFKMRVANDRTDRVFMSTESGLVIALRQRGASIPVFHKFPDRLPILPEVEPDPADAPVEGEKPSTEEKPAAEEKPATDEKPGNEDKPATEVNSDANN